MVEKGTEGRHSAFRGDMAIKVKGHVRVVRNSSLTHPPNVAIVKQQHQFEVKSDRSVRKNGARSVPLQSPVLLLSPNCRQNCSKGIGGYVSSSPSSREGSPRTSPTLGCNYAGAKFSEPPSPDTLPRPPPQWTDCLYISSGDFPLLPAEKTDKFNEITQQLKVLLKVPA